MSRTRSIVSIVALILTAALLTGCTGEAKITIKCLGNPVKGCVEGSCYEIPADGAKTFIVGWDQGINPGSKQTYSVYVEDLQFPQVNTTEDIEVQDGDDITYTIDNSKSVKTQVEYR